jgi:hypothetical protein
MTPISLRIRRADLRRAQLLSEQRRLLSALSRWTEELRDQRNLLALLRDGKGDQFISHKGMTAINRIRQAEITMTSLGILLRFNKADLSPHRYTPACVRQLSGA